MSDQWADRCPICTTDIGASVFDQGKQAGDEIFCPVCESRLVVYEHSNGYQGWFTFEEVDTPVASPRPAETENEL